MKKVFSVFLCFVILCTGVVYADSSDKVINFSFDSGSSGLTICGKFSDKAGEAVTMIVVNSASGKDFSSSVTPDMMFLYVTDSSGEIKINEKISPSFPGGRYDVILTGKNQKYENYFIFMNPDDPDTIALTDAINGASSADDIKTIVNADDNAPKLGLDLADSLVASYIDSALDDIIDCRTLVENGEFTPTSFLDMCSRLLAVRMINDGNVDEAMSRYASYFGTTTDQYRLDNAQTDMKFEEILKNAEYSVETLATSYSELLLAAQIKTSQNWSYLQDVILENTEVLDIETDDYNSIKKSSRYKVFSQMFDEIESYNTLFDIKLSFDNAVKSVIKDESRKKESSNKGSSGGGGSSSIKVPTTLAPVVVTPTTPKEEETSTKLEFNDIDNHFAREYIIALASDDVISGYGDGSFLPEGRITRAEFAKIIAMRFEIDEDGSDDYLDVPHSEWFATYVNSLSAAGIITGFNGLFNPHENITRQDAAVICMRTATYLSKNLEGIGEFEDLNDISDYALEAVNALASNGIINGDGKNFRPKDDITRAEASAVICRLYSVINR